MRERKLRSTAESLLRFRGSLIPYTCYIYKIKRKVKRKNTMRICSLSVPRLKHEWNQTVWSGYQSSLRNRCRVRVHDLEVACGGFAFFCCTILSVYIRPD